MLAILAILRSSLTAGSEATGGRGWGGRVAKGLTLTPS